MNTKMNMCGTSLVVQWLGLCDFTAVGLGSIPSRGTKIPASREEWPKTNKQTKEYVVELHIKKTKETVKPKFLKREERYGNKGIQGTSK